MPVIVLALVAVGAILIAAHLRVRLVARTRQLEALRQLYEQHARQEGAQDPLTGLATRARLLELVPDVLHSGEACVAVFDVIGLELINERGGAAAGDATLDAVARLLEAAVEPGDVVARVGSDEFAVVFRREGFERAGGLAVRLCEGDEVAVDLRCGVAAAQPGQVPDRALRNAESALAHARANARRIEVFDRAMRDHVSRRAAVAHELRRAIADGQLVLAYQPIVDLETSRLASVEALVRWQHPERGLLGPAEFVEHAERTGLAGQLGAAVLDAACAQIRSWCDALGERAPRIAVNVSAAQFEAGNVLAAVDLALRRHRCPAEKLGIELTETIFLAHTDRLEALVRELRPRGVRLYIDDFGTGYSSLAYVRAIDADVLKIDRSLLDGFGVDTQSSGVVAAILAMARALGVETIAEGVETRAQAALLALHGCTYGQGYLFAEPLDAAAVADLVASNRPLIDLDSAA